MKSTPRLSASHAVFGLTVILFFLGGLRDLGSLPKIYEDESLVAAPGWFLATTGVFAFPPDAGFAGSERHAFGFMPLHSILVGALLRATGPGLFEARLVSLAMAILILVLTYILASCLLTPAAGAVAVALLAFAPVQAPVSHLRLGIPMADLARLVRYDVSTGLFGLAALVVLAPSLARRAPPSSRRLAAAGVLVGLATLCHANGLLWLPALTAAALASYGRSAWRVALPPLAAGFGACLVPWALWVAPSLADYIAQNRVYSERVDLLSPGFYLTNLKGEIARYGLVLNAAHRSATPWLFATAFSAGALVLARRFRDPQTGAARGLLLPALVFSSLLALLGQSKNVLYLAPLWPLAALFAGLGAIEAWRRLGRIGRAGVALAGIVVAWEAASTWRSFAIEARATTPYLDVTRRIADLIPPGRRVMGLPHWWLGLVSSHPDYVTVPLHWSRPEFRATPVPFAKAADSFSPDVFLVDSLIRDLVTKDARVEAPLHELGSSVEAWLEGRGTLLATLSDATYGEVAVYGISATGPPISDAARSSTSSTETRMRQWRSPRAQTGCMQAPQERSSL